MSPKTNRRAPAYLAFVRRHDCCWCHRGSPIEAHHFGPRGTGLKADDYHAVPLCTVCHRMFHDRGTFTGQTRAETESLLWQTQARLLVEWLRTKSQDTGGADDVF